MKTRVAFFFSILAILFSDNIFADGEYFGVNLSQVRFQEPGIPEARPLALSISAGKKINKNFAVEARVAKGVREDEINVFDTPVEVEINQSFGVYVLGIIPLDVFSVYGVIGYSDGKITARTDEFSISDTDHSVSYGIGGDVFLGKNLSINVEYTKYFDNVYALSSGLKVLF